MKKKNDFMTIYYMIIVFNYAVAAVYNVMQDYHRAYFYLGSAILLTIFGLMARES